MLHDWFPIGARGCAPVVHALRPRLAAPSAAFPIVFYSIINMPLLHEDGPYASRAVVRASDAVRLSF